jgi:hypothetical protein
MDLMQQIRTLESRQTELRNKMSESDPHLWGCLKKVLELFRQTYPGDYAAYTAANEEYNTNEAKLAELQTKLDEERAVETRRPEEDGAPEV